MLCPYCSVQSANSRDHVFPDFLGGTKKIAACTHCNHTFGHTIEVAASGHLRNLMFLLRRCGMQPPKPMVWKKIALDASGIRYDTDQDLKAIVCTPSIERDTTGRITAARGSRRQLGQIQRSIKRDGRTSRIVPLEPVTIDMQRLGIAYPMDDDTKRLCIKMSIGASQAAGIFISLDARSRSYLLEASVLDVCPVRIAIDEYVELDRQRPPAGHLVYVRASPADRRAYSIVQLFSAIQFYCELASNYVGPDCAALATHDPITHKESFAVISPLDYSLPARYVTGSFSERFNERLERLRLELVALYDDQAPLSLRANE